MIGVRPIVSDESPARNDLSRQPATGAWEREGKG